MNQICGPRRSLARCFSIYDRKAAAILHRHRGVAPGERIRILWTNTRLFKAGLTDAGFDPGASETPITPVMVGDAAKAHEFSRALFDAGVLATGIGFPTVAQGKARVRTIVTAAHTREQLERAIAIFRDVGPPLGLTPG